ncbi:50S ribosomal protein L23 [Candidatus Bathyarchaeota archaeon ex4484_205]|nr:MAG: 50S ribosomal protein L23 [Candidatus Bathyarchaeota archaeon ex4484_205]RLG69418.1 MAG: 50S ribosomal protein L23 [archaeon]
MRYERIILYPLVTEKTMQMIEKENKLVFIVDRKANKKLVKKAVENLYNVKVERVNIMIGSRGKKKAFVKLTPQYSATELSMKLKIL